MQKYLLLLSIFLICPISAPCASLSDKSTKIDIADNGVAGEKMQLKLQTSAQLPASSFYRTEVDCPAKPAGAVVSCEMGYPVSDIVFSKAGKYECSVKFGILTKSSCAGVRYKALGEYPFTVDIKENN